MSPLPKLRPPPGRSGLRTIIGFALAALGLSAAPAFAVPSFAVQTGQPCQACHIGGFGPQLTPTGRVFKLHGYTTRAAEGFTMPASVMAVASYVRTQKDQASPPAAHFGTNDNVGLDQASLFIAGGLGDHLGGFVQTTYDGIGRAWSWDNMDLRATTTTAIMDYNVILGASLNNSPTTQDVWNTLPAWGYPYTTSALAPGPAAAPLLAGGLAQTTLGLTGYAWINSQVYIEAGAYRSPGATTLTRLGADPFGTGDIHGMAPYGRVAYQKIFGSQNIEVGAFGMRADIYPQRDRSTGATDRYTDYGLDASWQLVPEEGDAFTVNARWLNERRTLTASEALGLVENRRSTLRDLRADASYYWHDKVGATLAVFETTGSADPLLYADNRTSKPDSSGVSLQIDGTPFGGEGSPMGPRFNMRVGVQYTAYTKFNGARGNYDGAGAKASDNNTLRVFTWFAY